MSDEYEVDVDLLFKLKEKGFRIFCAEGDLHETWYFLYPNLEMGGQFGSFPAIEQYLKNLMVKTDKVVVKAKPPRDFQDGLDSLANDEWKNARQEHVTGNEDLCEHCLSVPDCVMYQSIAANRQKGPVFIMNCPFIAKEEAKL